MQAARPTVGSMRALLSLSLAFVLALAATAIAQAIDPTVFGSCFEGSCGYAAMLVAFLITLVLAPILWVALRRTGPVSRLLLGLVLFALSGLFLLPTFVWLVGLAAFAYAIQRTIRRARAGGQPMRDLFLTPRTRP